MSQPIRRSSLSLMVVLGLLYSMLLILAPMDGASAAAATTGKVRGNIVGTQGGPPKVEVTWFTSEWKYLGARKACDGVYYLTLAPGTYWLQFTDQRPAYDVTKYAPTNVKITVRANHTVVKSVRMHRGAVITGTARAGGKPARGARIVASNAAEESYTTTANKSGQFALGGLPSASYSVFTYDKSKQWTGKSTWVSRIRPGAGANLDIRLTKRAGGLLVDLYAGPDPLRHRVFVTAVSRKTGQFWTARASHGSVSFAGLFPGRYKLVAPGSGNYLGRTGPVTNGRVKPGRVAFGSFRLTTRGATVSGIVVDGEDEGYGLAKAQVILFDKAGVRIADTRTNGEGQFFFATQLTTQAGMVVAVNPDPDAGGYEQSSYGYCKFLKRSSAPFSITTSRDTDVGAIALPHAPAAEQGGAVQCYPSDGS
ncbi:MAG: hypothetical protein JWO76_83 [Nocardioides sp.]|nr:hypothetical protein [Nocardioides sp.]